MCDKCRFVIMKKREDAAVGKLPNEQASNTGRKGVKPDPVVRNSENVSRKLGQEFKM